MKTHNCKLWINFCLQFIFVFFFINKIYSQEVSKVKKVTKTEKKIKERAWHEKITPHIIKNQSEVLPAGYYYEISWNNIVRAGFFTVKVTKQNDNIITQTNGQSSGLASIFWNFSFDYASKVNLQNLLPKEAEISMTEGNKKTKVKSDFDFDAGLVKSKVDVTEGKSATKTDNKKFKFKTIHDLTSGIFFIRTLDLKIGNQFWLVFWPQDNPYLTHVKVLKKEKRNCDFDKSSKIDTIKLKIKIQKIKRSNHELMAYKKAKTNYVWLSDDKFKMPVEIRSEVFIGSIICKLKKRQIFKTKK